MDHPNDQRLLFSDVDAAIEWYEDKVEEVAQAESEMVSAAGRVTFERDKADGIDTDPEFEIPDDVINLADVDSDQSHCNRCREPVPETNEKTIGDIVFCPDCHDAVCGRCGQEIPDPENRYVTDGVGSGTTCPSCTADHVDWLCSECHTEIRDEAARVEITDGQLSGTYCQDCGSDVRERIDREDRTQNKDAPF